MKISRMWDMSLMSLVKKSYNGVAIISKVKIENLKKDFIKDDLNQARIISGEILLKKKKDKSN